jgi:hypothetical protein
MAEPEARMSELQRLWDKIAPPPLDRMCSISNLQGQILVVYANNGAIAAKVRQTAPTLMEKFQKRGVEVTSILVRVQVGFRPPKERPAKRICIGEAGLSSLRQLAFQLEASPLKAALEKMLERQAVEHRASHENQRGENEDQNN